jgi:hypothetical protein
MLVMAPERSLQYRSLVVSTRAGGREYPFLRGADFDITTGKLTVIEGLSPAEQKSLAEVLTGINAPIYGVIDTVRDPADLIVITDQCDAAPSQNPGRTVVILTNTYETSTRPDRVLYARAGLIQARRP